MKGCLMQNSSSFSIFGDMASQNFPLSRGTSDRIWIFTPEKWVNLKTVSFMSRILLLDLKLTPMSISAIFKQRKFFVFKTFDEERAAATP